MVQEYLCVLKTSAVKKLASASRLPCATAATASQDNSGKKSGRISILLMLWLRFHRQGHGRGVAAWRSQPSGCGLPMITMMQSADAGCTHDLRSPPRASFDHPEARRLLLQGIMNAIVVVIPKVISN